MVDVVVHDVGGVVVVVEVGVHGGGVGVDVVGFRRRNNEAGQSKVDWGENLNRRELPRTARPVENPSASC